MGGMRTAQARQIRQLRLQHMGKAVGMPVGNPAAPQAVPLPQAVPPPQAVSSLLQGMCPTMLLQLHAALPLPHVALLHPDTALLHPDAALLQTVAVQLEPQSNVSLPWQICYAPVHLHLLRVQLRLYLQPSLSHDLLHLSTR